MSKKCEVRLSVAGARTGFATEFPEWFLWRTLNLEEGNAIETVIARTLSDREIEVRFAPRFLPRLGWTLCPAWIGIVGPLTVVLDWILYLGLAR